MEHAEVIAIADAGDSSEETAVTEEDGLNASCYRDAAEVGPVEVDSSEGDGGENDGRDEGVRIEDGAFGGAKGDSEEEVMVMSVGGS